MDHENHQNYSRWNMYDIISVSLISRYIVMDLYSPMWYRPMQTNDRFDV